MKRRFLSFGLAFLVPAILTVSALHAQGPVAPSAAELQKLQDLADQVKAALQVGDLESANRLGSSLMLGIYKQRQALTPTPQDKLAKLEQQAPTTGAERFYALSNLAKAAFDAEQLDKAEGYANELLASAPEYKKDWNYGNAVFFGNMVLGRVALKRDKNIALAKSSLLSAGRTTGSPQLNSFGPNMSLAKDLLAVGERDTVLEFFTLCRKFWNSHPATLDAWTALVKDGGTPDFGANLLY